MAIKLAVAENFYMPKQITFR